LRLPGRDIYAPLKKGSGQQEVATTMATVRTFKEVLRDKEIGHRIVPIIPDEARTFGMDSWFPSLKIYNRLGQLYTAVDADLMLAYKESEVGQILHEGINEAGSVGSFTAAGTSYATHNEPMIPIYIFYSMFGFQRTGDGLWAAADQMARGFLLGATAGRTTLTGEGLQHADGHSLLLAATNPAAVSYDPAFAYEIAYIVESGLARMFGDNPENVYFYITVYNEPYAQPPEPDNFDPEGLLRGIYRYHTATEQRASKAQILASGVSMPAALKAAEMLAAEWDVAADVWSVTSWGELNRDGLSIEKAKLRHPDRPAGTPYVTQVLSEALAGSTGPVIAVSDWMRAVPEQIRPWVPGTFVTLGTDGFGFSDTRPAARRFFNTDADSQVVAVLEALARDGEIDPSVPVAAARQYRIDDVQAAPEQTSDPGPGA
ncbi:MAG TPA: pyruvate dehydrogenase (acetyl-transferring), homodimeric type, partial [Mycobacterium sp.]|nr:pyruvate dehydrogenase (acetyl-transferring), homodimeric type [Mycobacterium sp.]